MNPKQSLEGLFTEATQMHRAGQIQQAEMLYRRVLEEAPDHPDALHLLGLVCSQQGRHDEAVDLIRQAIAFSAGNPTYHNNLGEVYRRQGELGEAVQSYRRALDLAPGFADAHYNLANVLKAQGRLKGAAEHYRRAVHFNPDHARAHYNLGNALLEQEMLSEAVAAYECAVQVAPDFALAHHNLAAAQVQQGRLEEAARSYRRALALAPAYGPSHVGLAAILELQGCLEEAVSHSREAVRLSADDPAAHSGLGNGLLKLGRLDEAIESYQHALQIDADLVEAHTNIGAALMQQGKVGEATAHYRRVTELDPAFAEAYHNLILALEMQGMLTEARQIHRELEGLGETNTLLKFHMDTLCPVIPASNDEIDRYRSELDAALDGYVAREFEIDLADLHLSSAAPPYSLAYQGRDDRAVKAKWASIFDRQVDGGFAQPGKGKPHIGFLVTKGHESTFVRSMQRILNNLPANRFRLTVIHGSPAGERLIRPAIANPAVRYLSIPERIDLAIDIIRGARIDVLYYREVGSDTVNYFLPFFRLAPVQCHSWGIPVTSGIPQMDYYLSCDLLEPENGDAHYTETLVRLRGLPTFNRPLVTENLKPREDLGLREDQHIYLCAQNLLKVHPDFDPLAAEVLRRDSAGVLVFFGMRHPNLSTLLRQRLESTMPDVVDRVKFLPRLAQPDYMNVVALADVSLDTLHYCGSNCTNDAFVVGTPVVTLPGGFQRGLYTSAAYRTMGVFDCIADSAESYVEIALRLGTDPDYRARLGNQIKAECGILFEDLTTVESLAEFFERVIAQTRGAG